MNILFETALFLGFLPSGGEWFWIFLIVFLLFGPKKLPEIARILGKWGREIRNAKLQLEDEIEKAMEEEEASSGSIEDKKTGDWKDGKGQSG